MGLLLEFVRRRRFGSDNPFNSTGNFTQSSASAPVTQMVHNDQTGPASGPPKDFVDTPGGVIHDLTPRQGPSPTGSAKTPVRSVSTDVTPEGRALLDTIAGTESPGYNVMYGGKRFNDLSQHPGVAVPIQRGPNVGKTSSAAGRYQFLLPTWNRVSNQLGLKDFSPESQDKAAWHLAQTTYGQKTGRDLQNDLANGKHDLVGQALHGQWTSLPGGIEQSKNYNSQKFTQNFNQNLGRYNNPNPQVAGNNPNQNTPQQQQTAAANDNRNQQAQPNSTVPHTGSSTPQQMAANTPVQNAPPPPSVPPSTNPTSGQTSVSPQQAAPAPQAANDDEPAQRLAASASPWVRMGHRALSEINTVRGKNMPKLRSFFIEADPIQAGLQVDFEEREADPLQYGMPTHNIHPASEVDPGADDGMGAPYDGAPIPGQEGEGLPPGGAMPMQDDQMSPITPQAGGQMPPGQQMQPPMREGLMDFDKLLDDILQLDEALPPSMQGPGAVMPNAYHTSDPAMQSRWNQASTPGGYAQMQQQTNAGPAAARAAAPSGPNPRAQRPGNYGPSTPPSGAVPPAGAGGMGAPRVGQAPAGTPDRMSDNRAAATPASGGAGLNNPSWFRQTGSGPNAQTAVSNGGLNNPGWFKPTGNAPDAQRAISGGPSKPAAPPVAPASGGGMSALNSPAAFKRTGNAPDAQGAVAGPPGAPAAPAASAAAPAAPGASNLGVGGAVRNADTGANTSLTRTASLNDWNLTMRDLFIITEAERAAERKVRGY